MPRLRLPYMPGLDGLRGLSVLAVLAYHAALPWSDGGFLGVEVFFVLSGYLITALLVLEIQHTGRVNLARFWRRRARRLLPALWLLLALVVPAAWLWMPEALPRLREDTWAALAYVTNWVYILREIPYFERYARPPLLQHLWSLAIEEQFYLLWPLLVLALTRGARGRRGPVLGGLAVLAAASLAARWALYEPFADASRVYYGTDTRAAGLVLGALLAVAWPPARATQPHALPRAWAEVLGWSGLAGLLAAFVGINDYTPFLYRGGFLLTDLATLAVLVGVTHPRTWVRRFLAARLWRWVGQRSYGLYLWHWPVFLLLEPALGPAVQGGWALWVPTALTFALAAVSYAWVEHPIRRRGVRAWARQVRAWATTRPAGGLSLAVLSVAVLALDGWLLLNPAVGSRLPTPTPAATQAAASRPGLPTPRPTRAAPREPRPTARPRPTTTRASAPALISPTPPTPIPGPRLTVLGDSVAQAAVTFDFWAPWQDQVVVDVQEGRTMQDVPEVAAQLAAEGRLAPVVVVHLGTNRPFPPEAVDEAMRALLKHGARQVVFLTIRRPVRWEAFVNENLAAAVTRWPQARLLDWHRLALDNPQWFVEDGTHLRYYGAQAYVDFIMEAVARDAGLPWPVRATPTP